MLSLYLSALVNIIYHLDFFKHWKSNEEVELEN